MKHTKKSKTARHQPPHIKIYTSPEIIEAFAARAAEQGRSVSKQGEFLVKQDLTETPHKVA